MSAGPVLEGRLVRLRPGDESDIAALMALFEDPTVLPWWKAHDESGVREHLDSTEEVGWVIEADGAVVGWIEAWEEDEADFRHGGIDIACVQGVHGTGVGPEAVTLARDWLMTAKEHHRVTIDPALSNRRAIAAYHKLGFRTVGVMRRYERSADGTWRDGLLMEFVAGIDD